MVPPELFANTAVPGVPSALTTLSGNGGSITSSATSFNTAAAAPVALQGSGQFRILIDSELMIVTAGASGLTWTVTRGAEGSTAASHTDGALIYHILTAGALAGFPQNPVVNSFNGRTGAVVPGSGDYIGVPAGGLTGATTAFRMVGATGGGAPTTGTFVVGDIVLDRANAVWYRCTVAGSPGTWVQFPGGSGSATLAGDTDVSITSPANGQVLTYSSGTSKWTNQAAGTASFPYINVMASPYNATGNGTTDDTAAVQAAVTAAGALATTTGQQVLVVLPAGKSFLLSEVDVVSGVMIWAYGAVIKPNLATLATNRSVFYFGVGGTLNSFGIRGGFYAGQGTETNTQAVFHLQSSTASPSSGNDLTFQDMYVKNWGTAVLFIANPSRLKVIDNTITDPGLFQDAVHSFNIIDISADGAVAIDGEIIVSRNIVLQALADAIAFVTLGTFNGSLRCLFTENITSGFTGAGNGTNSGAISVELDAGTASGFGAADITIANNDIVSYGNNGGVLLGGGTAGGGITAFHVTGNRVNAQSTTQAMLLKGAGCYGTVANNTLIGWTSVPIQDTTTSSNITKTGNRFSTGAMQGRATLVGGAVTVSTSEVQNSDNIQLTCVVKGGTQGDLSVGTITNHTSFVINSTSASDTSTVYWNIDH